LLRRGAEQWRTAEPRLTPRGAQRLVPGLRHVTQRLKLGKVLQLSVQLQLGCLRDCLRQSPGQALQRPVLPLALPSQNEASETTRHCSGPVTDRDSQLQGLQWHLISFLIIKTVNSCTIDIPTDGSWQPWTKDRIVKAEIYEGEYYQTTTASSFLPRATLGLSGTNWPVTSIMDTPQSRLFSSFTALRRFAPRGCSRRPEARFDFGKNAAGTMTSKDVRRQHKTAILSAHALQPPLHWVAR
jgi:hypothetical protein